MSVDRYREEFHITRLAASDIGGNWLAQAYRPDVLRAFRAVEVMAHSTIGKITNGRVSQGRSPVYADVGVPCLKTKDVLGIQMNLQPESCVSVEFATANPALRVPHGAVLINRSGAGSIGRVGVFLGDGEYFTNEHLIRLEARSDFDSCYLTAFLASWYGERVLERGVTGATGQLNLAGSFVHELPVAVPGPKVQTYIGDKVRQAEALRVACRELQLQVDEVHARYIPEEPGAVQVRQTVVNSSRLTDRLDAEFYPAEVDRYFINSAPKNAKISTLWSDGFSGTTRDEVDVSTTQQATVTNLSSDFLGGVFRIVAPMTTTRKQLRNHDLLICAAAHKASYIGKDITYAVLEEGERIVPSTEVLVIRPNRAKVPASYLRAFLRSKMGYRQLQACVRGITAHLYPQDVAHIRVPVPTVAAEDCDVFESTDALMLLAAEQKRAAKRLTTAARLLVEALIEGNVTEAELIAAHTDRAADRALLARLKTAGLDGDGDLLFPDLDRLFELLAGLSDAKQPTP